MLLLRSTPASLIQIMYRIFSGQTWGQLILTTSTHGHQVRQNASLPYETVSFERHRLIKASGTCVIEMAAESSENQLATWNSVKTVALRITETCVKGMSQIGGSYVGKSCRSTAPVKDSRSCIVTV